MCVTKKLGISQCYLGPIQQLVPLRTCQRMKKCQGREMDKKKVFPIVNQQKCPVLHLGTSSTLFTST